MKDKTKEQIAIALNNHKPYGKEWSRFLLPDQIAFLYNAFKEYANQQTALLKEENERLKELLIRTQTLVVDEIKEFKNHTLNMEITNALNKTDQ